MPWNLISPNRMCAKINLAKFSRNTAHLGLAKFFPSENFPLYGIPNCSRGHGGCSAASLGMLSQSRLQRQRLQRCRIYPQVGDKSHWNSRERVLEPEELSFLGGPPTSDTETREGAKRAAEGASLLTYAWANTSLTLAPHCLHSPS